MKLKKIFFCFFLRNFRVGSYFHCNELKVARKVCLGNRHAPWSCEYCATVNHKNSSALALYNLLTTNRRSKEDMIRLELAQLLMEALFSETTLTFLKATVRWFLLLLTKWFHFFFHWEHSVAKRWCCDRKYCVQPSHPAVETLGLKLMQGVLFSLAFITLPKSFILWMVSLRIKWNFSSLHVYVIRFD